MKLIGKSEDLNDNQKDDLTLNDFVYLVKHNAKIIKQCKIRN